MLGQRRGRWPNIQTFIQCWFNAGRWPNIKPALDERLLFDQIESRGAPDKSRRARVRWVLGRGSADCKILSTSL